MTCTALEPQLCVRHPEHLYRKALLATSSTRREMMCNTHESALSTCVHSTRMYPRRQKQTGNSATMSACWRRDSRSLVKRLRTPCSFGRLKSEVRVVSTSLSPAALRTGKE